MAGSRPARLVEAALRCYPPRWRSRHGDEAAELATLLMRDGMPGESVRQVLPALESLHVKIVWETDGGKPVRWPVPAGRYYVAGGTALSAGSIVIRIAPKDPAPSSPEGSHGRHC